MRRWLLILFVAMLPLQFSWAAVASYCTHEEPPAKQQHFGHHEHEHDDASDGGSTSDKSALEVDEDCAYCHLGCAQPLPMAPFGLPHLDTAPHVAVMDSLHDSHVPPGLERPDRRAA